MITTAQIVKLIQASGQARVATDVSELRLAQNLPLIKPRETATEPTQSKVGAHPNNGQASSVTARPQIDQVETERPLLHRGEKPEQAGALVRSDNVKTQRILLMLPPPTTRRPGHPPKFVGEPTSLHETQPDTLLTRMTVRSGAKAQRVGDMRHFITEPNIALPEPNAATVRIRLIQELVRTLQPFLKTMVQLAEQDSIPIQTQGHRTMPVPGAPTQSVKNDTLQLSREKLSDVPISILKQRLSAPEVLAVLSPKSLWVQQNLLGPTKLQASLLGQGSGVDKVEVASIVKSNEPLPASIPTIQTARDVQIAVALFAPVFLQWPKPTNFSVLGRERTQDLAAQLKSFSIQIASLPQQEHAKLSQRFGVTPKLFKLISRFAKKLASQLAEVMDPDVIEGAFLAIILGDFRKTLSK